MAMTMMMSENPSSQSQVHVKLFRGTKDLAVKSQLKEASQCLYVWGGGSVITQHESHNRKWTVNATFVTSHQADWPTATDFILYSRFAVHNILLHYFGTGEDSKTPGLIPSDTLPPSTQHKIIY